MLVGYALVVFDLPLLCVMVGWCGALWGCVFECRGCGVVLGGGVS